MVWILVLSGIVLYLRAKSDKRLLYFTGPNDDWLIGFERVQEVILPNHDFEGSLSSLGIGVVRVDFLTNKKEEQDG